MLSLKKNSFNLLISYGIFLIGQQFLMRLQLANNWLFLLLSIWYVIGTGALYWLNQKPTFTNPNFHQDQLHHLKDLYWIILGLVLVFLVQLFGNWVNIALLHQVPISKNTSQLLAIYHHYPIYVLLVLILAPFIEELIFRKVLFANLSMLIKPAWAALISSLGFMIIHGDGNYVTYFLLGVVLCWLYQKTKILTVPIIVHLLMNVIVFGLMLK